MDFFEGIFESIIPLLIFIIIPIIRGLNNSKKQKREYERRRSMRKTPYEQPNVPARGAFESIIEELRKDIQEKLNMEEGEPGEGKLEIEESIETDHIDYDDKESQVPVYDLHRPLNVIEETTIDLEVDKESLDNILNFSPNSIIQGLIFSEILGSPKSQR